MNPPNHAVKFSTKAYTEYLWWMKNHPATAIKIDRLIAAAYENPLLGIGKPEPLKYDLTGYYSRRITAQDRMIYAVTDEGVLYILSLRYHY